MADDEPDTTEQAAPAQRYSEEELALIGDTGTLADRPEIPDIPAPDEQGRIRQPRYYAADTDTAYQWDTQAGQWRELRPARATPRWGLPLPGDVFPADYVGDTGQIIDAIDPRGTVYVGPTAPDPVGPVLLWVDTSDN